MAHHYPVASLGILGGGQLGRMLIYDALRMGVSTNVLDPDPDAPCGTLADRFVVGPLDDERSIRSIAEASDVLTWEIEHVSVPVLESLTREGYRVAPQPSVLRIIQDKLQQKEFLQTHGLPVPRFRSLPANITSSDLAPLARDFGMPCVQKTRFGGYDGRGVLVIESPRDFAQGLPGSTMLEERIEIATEIAVLVSRRVSGETAVFPVVDMEFSAGGNICTMVRCPSTVERTIQTQAEGIALRAVELLDAIGVVAVELFVTKAGEVLVNEIAPRPHNSGHLTIEACAVSQFEQHIRAVLDLPLGSTTLHRPAAMINLLGAADGGIGRPTVVGLEETLAVPGVSIHLYGKQVCKPGRKMGHVTVTAERIEDAVERARIVQNALEIRGGENGPSFGNHGE